MAFDWIDAHNHLGDPRFDGRRAAVLERARALGITRFIQGGVDPNDWQRQLALRHEGVLPVFGLHPWFVARASDGELEAAVEQLRLFLPQAVALGELGLDFSPKRDADSFPRQCFWFRKQLAMALAAEKPLVLHLVQCHGEAPAMLREFSPSWSGIVHGFTGSFEVAQSYLRLGLSLSIGGAVLSPGHKKLKLALPRIPEGRLVVESDAPDGAPAGSQDGINEPDSLLGVAEAVGALCGRTQSAVLATSTTNLHRIFFLEPLP